jgi:hypothetical protein
MGILDKIMFWKKEEEPELGPLPGEPAMPGAGMPEGLGPLPGEGKMPGMPEGPGFGGPLMPETQVTPSQQAPEMQQIRPAAMQPAALEPKQDFLISKDLEIISTKLDTLKASLDSINQRLSVIEKMAEQGQFRRSQW